MGKSQGKWDQAIDSEEVVTPLMLDGTYLSRNFATLGPMIRQPPCDLRSCAWLLHPNIKNQGKGMSEVNRFGDEERRLMHLVPAHFHWQMLTVSQSSITFLHYNPAFLFSFLL